MLLGFKKRFIPFVEEGSKTHTIRAKLKRGSRQAGEICHCYTGLRQKGARLLGRWKCLKVEPILIFEGRDHAVSVIIGDVELSADEKNALAWRDGFRGRGKEQAFSEMVDYWASLHPQAGPLEFQGDLIHWQYEAAGELAISLRSLNGQIKLGARDIIAEEAFT